MAKLTRSQKSKYDRLVARRAEYVARGYDYLIAQVQAEIDLLEAVAARTTKQVNYRDQHNAHVELWGAQIVTRVNLMSGKEYKERRDTPSYLSPASESYWSM